MCCFVEGFGGGGVFFVVGFFVCAWFGFCLGFFCVGLFGFVCFIVGFVLIKIFLSLSFLS